MPFRTQVPRGRRRIANRASPTPSRVAGVWQLDDPDLDVNAEWDRLIKFAVHAWCWRDPSTVCAVEECLARLKASVERDWK